MLDLGIKVKVDLIIGLPGDTVESVRRGIDYIHRSGLYSQVQVFNLAVLPGTAFREEAKQLGLVFQDRPPYYVIETPTLSTHEMYDLMSEAEDVFETEFDPLPEVQWPAIGGEWSERMAGDGIAGLRASPLETEGPEIRDIVSNWCINLDNESCHESPAATRTQAFTLWLRSSSFDSHRRRAAAIVEQVLADNPFTTLQIVLEPVGNPEHLSLATCDAIMEAAMKNPTYLDRFYSVQPGQFKGAKRIVIALPQGDEKSLDTQLRNTIGQIATIMTMSPPELVAESLLARQ